MRSYCDDLRKLINLRSQPMHAIRGRGGGVEHLHGRCGNARFAQARHRPQRHQGFQCAR